MNDLLFLPIEYVGKVRLYLFGNGGLVFGLIRRHEEAASIAFRDFLTRPSATIRMIAVPAAGLICLSTEAAEANTKENFHASRCYAAAPR